MTINSDLYFIKDVLLIKATPVHVILLQVLTEMGLFLYVLV